MILYRLFSLRWLAVGVILCCFESLPVELVLLLFILAIHGAPEPCYIPAIVVSDRPPVAQECPSVHVMVFDFVVFVSRLADEFHAISLVLDDHFSTFFSRYQKYGGKQRGLNLLLSP